VVRYRNVSYSYASENRPVLDELDFEWNPKGVLVLAGPNGSGKTTVLRLLLGLGKPATGAIEIGGVDLFALDFRAWRRQIAFVPQRPFLPDHLTIRETLRLTLPRTSENDLERALERVGLFESVRTKTPKRPLDTLASTLSAGQRQRLVLARALAAQTPVLLLDEPDANLDAAGLELLLDLLRTRGDTAIAIAAHTHDLVAAGDQVVWLKGPRLD
jgi:ATP-binding cassette subfamily C protein CydCD